MIETAQESNASAVSWAAIAAGAVAAAALSLVLVAFGAGMGFSSVSPWSGAAISGTKAEIAAGIYLLVAAMLSSTLGGFVAGRLRTKWAGLHGDEVFFRDTAHGFLAWAFATCVTAAFLTSAIGSIAGGASSVAGSVMQAGASGDSLDYFTSGLLRPAQPGAAPAPDAAATKAEVGQIVASALRSGDLGGPDRTYLTQVVAAKTGLSQADAQARVTDTVNAAKTAADVARKAAAHLALWLTASLFLGAFCASIAATEGGMMRDRND